MSDIIEIGGGEHEPLQHAAMAAGLPRSWYTVFRNGQPIHHYPTFEKAMRAAFPGWEPPTNYEAKADDTGESADY